MSSQQGCHVATKQTLRSDLYSGAQMIDSIRSYGIPHEPGDARLMQKKTGSR